MSSRKPRHNGDKHERYNDDQHQINGIIPGDQMEVAKQPERDQKRGAT